MNEDGSPLTSATNGGGLLGVAAQLARGRRARRALTALVTATAVQQTAKPVYDKLLSRYRDHTTFTVAIESNDDIYEDVQRYLLDRMPDKARRSLTAKSGRTRTNDDDVRAVPDGGTPEPTRGEVALWYDGTKVQRLAFDGHKVDVKIEHPDVNVLGVASVKSDEFERWARRVDRVVFTASSAAGRDAVIRFLGAIIDAKYSSAEPESRYWVATRWADWNRVKDLPGRKLDTVILKDGQLEQIVDDLARFFALEQKYLEVGIPWHRGYLFHGEPGTGKTSTASALARRFGLDVHYLPLSDMEADTNLHSLLARVDTRSMLVLEDIDIVHGAKSRDDAESRGVSLSGLLNALDGLGTPHGLITIMTTNRIETLDDALVRPGRADLKVEFGALDDDQLLRLFDVLTGNHTRGHDYIIRRPLPRLGDVHLTHAEVVEAAKPWLDNRDAVATAVRTFLLDRGCAEPDPWEMKNDGSQWSWTHTETVT